MHAGHSDGVEVGWDELDVKMMDPVLAQRLVVEQQMVALQSEMASQGAGLMGTYSGDFTTLPAPATQTSNFASPSKPNSTGRGTDATKAEKERVMLERNGGLQSSPGVSSFKLPGGDSRVRSGSWGVEGREGDAQRIQNRGQGLSSADVTGEFGVYGEAGRGVGGSGDGSGGGGGGGGGEGLGSAALEALERMADRGRGTRIQGLSVDLTPYVNTSAFMVSHGLGSGGTWRVQSSMHVPKGWGQCVI